MLLDKIREIFGPKKEKNVRVFRDTDILALLPFHFSLLLVHVYVFSSTFTFFSFFHVDSLGFTFSLALCFSPLLL